MNFVTFSIFPHKFNSVQSFHIKCKGNQNKRKTAVHWSNVLIVDMSISSKVPGAVDKVKDHALQKDLTKLSKREILDLKCRQEKLLQNK